MIFPCDDWIPRRSLRLASALHCRDYRIAGDDGNFDVLIGFRIRFYTKNWPYDKNHRASFLYLNVESKC